MEASKYTIADIKHNIVTIQESNYATKPINKTIALDKITFKGHPAPVNLIAVGAQVFMKQVKRNEFSVWLDPNLDIYVKFGYVKAINPEQKQQTLIISDYQLDTEIIFNKLTAASGKKIPLEEIMQSKNRPIYIYFNADAIIEAKLIEPNKKIQVKLDAFTRIGTIEDSSLFCFKDQKLIVYKVPFEKVFYANSNTNFPADTVQSHIGIDTEITFDQENVVVAYIKVAAPQGARNSSPQVDHRSNKSLARNQIMGKKDNKSLEVNSGYNTVMPSKSKNNQTKINPLPPGKSNNSFNLNEKKNVVPDVKGNLRTAPVVSTSEKYKRKLDSKTNCFFNEFKDRNLLILFSLLETLFRFPQKNDIQENLNQTVDEICPKLRNIISLVFNLKRNINQKTQLPQIYSVVYENLIDFQALARRLFEPLNLEEISENYGIIIYEYKSNENSYTTYTPFSVSQSRFPYVILQCVPEFKILYNEGFMKYDGFSLNNGHPENCIDVSEDLLLATKPQVQPNITGIFNLISVFQSFLSENPNIDQAKFDEIKNQATCYLKSLTDLIDPNSFNQCRENFLAVVDSKLENSSAFICQSCQSEKLLKYKCSNSHKICKECALLSNVRKSSLCCNSQENFDIYKEQYSCSYCKNSFEAKYFLAINTCRCILDSSCGGSIYSSNICPVHNTQIPYGEIQLIHAYHISLQSLN